MSAASEVKAMRSDLRRAIAEEADARRWGVRGGPKEAHERGERS
jgi:hypothetical protein